MIAFFQYLTPGRIPLNKKNLDPLEIQQEMILQRILNIFTAIYVVGFPFVFIFYPRIFRSGLSLLYLVFFAVLAGITIARSISFHLRAILVILILYVLGLQALINYGLSGTGLLFLFSSAIVVNMLYRTRIGGIYTLLTILTIAAIGAGMVTGRMALPPVEILANSGAALQWVIAGAVFLILMSLVMGSLFVVVQGLNASLQEHQSLARQLEEEQSSLERRVEERSSELKKRVAQFEIASTIARNIASQVGLENLLNSAVNQIRDQFGYYYVAIFLNDDRNEFAYLRAATGEAGQALLHNSHRLKIGEVGIVGYVTSRGEPRIALDVNQDVVHYKNPLLPETKSEMALPLQLGSQTIGALDVQSVLPNAFVSEDNLILQILADQIAIAIENSRLVETLKHSVDELEANFRSSTQKAWRSHLRNTRPVTAYRYHESRLEPAEGGSELDVEAMLGGNTILKILPAGSATGKAHTVMAVPIKLRSQVLGVVDIHFEGASISPGLVELIEGTINRLAVSLENARLLEENQFRAERELLVGEISARVRSATDVDSVLRIAAQEIGQSLGVSEVLVQLRKET